MTLQLRADVCIAAADVTALLEPAHRRTRNQGRP